MQPYYPYFVPTSLPVYAQSPWTRPAHGGGHPDIFGLTPENRAKLTGILAKSINAEHNAIRIYGRLAEMTQDPEFRRVIESIRADEARHFARFSALYAQLTGGGKPALSDRPLPGSFAAGVEDSIKDELEDSKGYQEAAELAGGSVIGRTFMGASHDEQRHATWFLYMWNKIGH